MDNLVGTYTAIRGLIESLEDGQLAQDGHIRIAACYDNEEVGRESLFLTYKKDWPVWSFEAPKNGTFGFKLLE